MNNNGYRNIVFLSQLAINVMVPTFLCLGIGLLIDKQLGTWSSVPLLFIGLAAGLRNVYVVAKAAIDKEERERVKKEQEEIDDILRKHLKG